MLGPLRGEVIFDRQARLVPAAQAWQLGRVLVTGLPAQGPGAPILASQPQWKSSRVSAPWGSLRPGCQ